MAESQGVPFRVLLGARAEATIGFAPELRRASRVDLGDQEIALADLAPNEPELSVSQTCAAEIEKTDSIY